MDAIKRSDAVEKKIGFIGCGNMGKAILGGLLASGQARAENVWVYTPSEESLAALKQEYGVNTVASAQEVAQAADIVFGAVKPNIMLKVMSDIASSLNKDSLVVSIAAGITLDQLANVLGHDRKIIRTMPNTPSLVGAGMTSITPNALASDDDIQNVLAIFRSFGEAEVVAEYLIHPVVGVSGSAPAYVFMFIEAMADAAVLGGMPRAQAYKFAAQAVMGSAKMVLETGKHPGELKDMVCSPGGTTIEAVRVLEERGMRAAVIEAMAQCMAKSEKLSKG
nr:pyrroline-5-carboxylate reductase [Cronobacter dublinensis]